MFFVSLERAQLGKSSAHDFDLFSFIYDIKTLTTTSSVDMTTSISKQMDKADPVYEGLFYNFKTFFENFLKNLKFFESVW